MNPNVSLLFRVCAVAVFIVSVVFAQSANRGAVTGRIFNLHTGEYVRNAEVHNPATGETVTSEAGGYYRLSNLVPGETTLTVSFSGYATVSGKVVITAGQTATLDLSLARELGAPEAPGAGEKTVMLETFVVSSEREGNAKAIMEQRNSMNITNTIASEVFGDNAEGNIGEFLRNVPGVYLDTAYGEVRNVGLGGLGSEYTSVTLDGMTLAGADASGSGITTRAITFEMASLSSMDSLEVSRTISADVDANAPAGTINLRSKRAFDREGRRVTWQANLGFHSEEFTLKRTPGPDDSGLSRKGCPGGIFEYSDVFLDKRLGIVLNISESNIYQEAVQTTNNYNRTPTKTDPREQVLTSIVLQHAPRFNERFATTLTTDFRATRKLALSLTTIYNHTDLWTPQRSVTLNTGGRTSVVGDEVSFQTTGTAATVVSNPIATAKIGKTVTLLPKFEYKSGDFTFEGRFSYSESESWYDPFTVQGSIRDANNPTVRGNFRAERSSLNSVDWKITQISGNDFADGASYTTPAVSVNDRRWAGADIMSGELISTLKTNLALPVLWKAGVKTRYEAREFEDDRAMLRYRYDQGGTGWWSKYRSSYEFDLGMTDAAITSLSGGTMFMPDLAGLGRLFREQPEAFSRSWSATNYYTTYVTSRRKFFEEVNAAFLMATSTLRKATFRAGIRWEDTGTDSVEYDALTSDEVKAAGYPVSSGVATTVDGINYQFLSRPRIHRRGGYDNFFPSGSFKYRFTRNLDFNLGFSTTIRRPNYGDVSGVWVVNDEMLRVTAPNIGLKPETARNYAARLAYYFEPVGQLTVSVFQNDVKNLHAASELTAEEFGYSGDQDYSNYTFVTTMNRDERVRVRSLEIAYGQSLGFLGSAFRRLSIRANYTRSYANIIKPNLVPHAINGGFDYTLGRFNTYVNANWLDTYPVSATGLSFRLHRTTLDAGAGWKLDRHFSLSVSARNILKSSFDTMQWVAPNPPTLLQQLAIGANITFAIKGTF